MTATDDRSTTDGTTDEAIDAEGGEHLYDLIGGGSAVMHVVVFTLVGHLALESLAYGAVAGVFAGVGTYLFIPWFFRLSAVQEATGEDLGFTELADRIEGSAQLGILGLGLELGAIGMIAAGLALEEADFLVGVPAGFLVAGVVFLVGTVLLGR